MHGFCSEAAEAHILMRLLISVVTCSSVSSFVKRVINANLLRAGSTE